MNFDELAEYRKDIKHLIKKYRTLHEDMEVVKKVLTVVRDESPPFSYRIDNLGITTCIIKVKKLHARH
jgi:hypothetical protein